MKDVFHDWELMCLEASRTTKALWSQHVTFDGHNGNQPTAARMKYILKYIEREGHFYRRAAYFGLRWGRLHVELAACGRVWFYCGPELTSAYEIHEPSIKGLLVSYARASAILERRRQEWL